MAQMDLKTLLISPLVCCCGSRSNVADTNGITPLPKRYYWNRRKTSKTVSKRSSKLLLHWKSSQFSDKEMGGLKHAETQLKSVHLLQTLKFKFPEQYNKWWVKAFEKWWNGRPIRELHYLFIENGQWMPGTLHYCNKERNGRKGLERVHLEIFPSLRPPQPEIISLIKTERWGNKHVCKCGNVIQKQLRYFGKYTQRREKQENAGTTCGVQRDNTKQKQKTSERCSILKFARFVPTPRCSSKRRPYRRPYIYPIIQMAVTSYIQKVIHVPSVYEVSHNLVNCKSQK